MKHTLPVIRPKEVIRTLQRAGFFVHHVTGSHYILKHPGKPAIRVTIPFHNRDLKRGTLQSIVKQAGFTNEGVFGFAMKESLERFPAGRSPVRAERSESPQENHR